MEKALEGYDINLYEIGEESCIPEKNILYNPRSWHVIHYVTSGKGTYELNGVTYEVKKGDIFYIPPFARPFYKPEEKDPWNYIWIGFNGSKAMELLQNIHLSEENPIFSDNHFEARPLFYDLSKAYYQSGKITIQCLGYFYIILSSLIRLNQESLVPTISVKESNVIQAKEFMKHNYQFNLTISEVASSLHLSPNYLANIFQEIEHSTPKEYLTKLRMTKALELLKTKKLKVKEVAALCGYPKQLHFSSEFKKYYGLSPSFYANIKEAIL